MKNPKVRAVLLFLLVITFGVLMFGGYLMNREKPPIPTQVKGPGGEVVFTAEQVMDGQNYYFSRGGQHMGTIWGHGSYLAPDWSADYLHRLGIFLAARHHGLDETAAQKFTQQDFDALDVVEQGRLPGDTVTYTSNWPYDPLVGNEPIPGALIWSIVSVVILILAISLVVFLYIRHGREDDAAVLVTDFQEPTPTPSQKALLPYFARGEAAAQVELLDAQWRTHGHDGVQPPAVRHLPALLCGEVWPLVRAQPGNCIGSRD